MQCYDERNSEGNVGCRKSARPGGGFWNETQPLALFGKAFGIGNQCAMTTEPKVRDVLRELEGHPRLSYKSPRKHVVVCAMAVAMGCNGIMSNSAVPWPDPRTRAVYAAINAARPQLNAFLLARQGLKLVGVSVPFRTDFDRVRPAKGTWNVRAAVPLFDRFMTAYVPGCAPETQPSLEAWRWTFIERRVQPLVRRTTCRNL